jgi:DNA-directed RNA polymerase subunit E'/Rpb7
MDKSDKTIEKTIIDNKKNNGPYFITTLEADVRIAPNQMNNNIMDAVKKNLDIMYSNKCYNNYGYIEKIVDIDDNIKGGNIRAEDTTAAAVLRVSFKCRICNPIKKSIIMGKIAGINSMMIIAKNGPIRFIIGESNINTNNIQFRKSAYYPVSQKGEIIKKPITKGTYVMIQVMGKKVAHNSSQITVFGRLESVIHDDDIMEAIRDQYESNEHISVEDLTSNRPDNNENEDETIVNEGENQDSEDDDNND